MKTAVYIEGQTLQVVLTPESDLERVLLQLPKGPTNITIKSGSFYETPGGWFRQGSENNSLILRIDQKSETAEIADNPSTEVDTFATLIPRNEPSMP